MSCLGILQPVPCDYQPNSRHTRIMIPETCVRFLPLGRDGVCYHVLGSVYFNIACCTNTHTEAHAHRSACLLYMSGILARMAAMKALRWQQCPYVLHKTEPKERHLRRQKSKTNHWNANSYSVGGFKSRCICVQGPKFTRMSIFFHANLVLS